MNKVVRRILIGGGVLVGILLLLSIGIGLFFDINHYKPQIEAAVAKSTGMELKLVGKASLKIFPRIRIALRGIHLTHLGSKVFAADELDVTPHAIPFLLHREILIDHISLMSPKIQVEKNAAGRMNYETSKPSESQGEQTGKRLERVHSVSVKDGVLSYLDRRTGEKIQAKGVNAKLSEINWSMDSANSKESYELIKSISFNGNLGAESVQVGSLTASNIKATVRDAHGLINIYSTQTTIFGGMTEGTAEINLRSSTPQLKIAQTASHIDLSQALSKQKPTIAGFVDVVVNLSASGKDTKTLTRTANGNMSIHSQKITLTGVDVDDLAGKLKTAQALDLVNLGSLLLSGPLAPALGQSANISGKASNAKSEIQKLVSNWKINNGIAEAKDVAFSTGKTTVAFKGKLNLIDKRYQDFYIATVDSKGCAKNKLEISGPLKTPKPVAGSVGEQISKSFLGKTGSAAGSVGSKIGEFFGSKKKATPEPKSKAPTGCDLFYSGEARTG